MFIKYNISFSFIFLAIALSGQDEVLIKRARHVITEMKRTFDAAEALKRRDFKQVSFFDEVKS